MRVLLMAAALAAAPVPAAGQTRVERLGPLRVRGRQAAMEGPFITKSLELERDSLLRSIAVRLLLPDGTPDPDPRRLCHVTLAHAERTHVARLAPHLVTLDLGSPRVELPAGYGLLLKGSERYLLNAMLASDDPADDAERLFEVSLELEEAGRPGAPRPLESVVVGLTASDAHEHHATAQYDWLVPPGARRDYRRTRGVPRDLLVRGLSLHLHRYATSASIAAEPGGRALFSRRVPADAEGRLRASPAVSFDRPLRLPAAASPEFSVSYHNTGDSPAPVMGVFYLFVDPAPGSR